MNRTKRSKNYRIFQRHIINKAVDIKAGNSREEKKRLNNISLGGLSFKSGKKLRPGTRVDVDVVVNDTLLKTTGRVLWSKENKGIFDVGAEFTDPRYTTRAKIIAGLQKKQDKSR